MLEDPAVATALPGLAQAVACIGHSQIRNRTTVGGSVAHADPSAELPAVLVGVGGEVVLASVRGERCVAAADLFDGSFSTTRRPDELVTAVRFPIPPGATGWDEVCRRPGDFALAGLFAALHLDAGVVLQARLALSGVADRPVRAIRAEAALIGHPVDRSALAACAGRSWPSFTHPTTSTPPAAIVPPSPPSSSAVSFPAWCADPAPSGSAPPPHTS